MRYWLIKSEPSEYSIEDLARDRRAPWNGVRNHQARNFMRDEMRIGDLVLFYHSSADPTGVVGLARVASEAYPDASAFDPKDKYHDPRSDPKNPTWYHVDIEHVETLPRCVTLAELRAEPRLSGMRILQRGNRLSVTPVTKAEFDQILQMAGHRAGPNRGSADRSRKDPEHGRKPGGKKSSPRRDRHRVRRPG